MSLAQLALAERSAAAIHVPGEHGRASLALAHAASCGIAAGEQLNLFGHVRHFRAPPLLVPPGAIND